MGRLSSVLIQRPGTTAGTVHSWTLSIVYDHRSRPLYVSAYNTTTATESRYWYYYDREDRLSGVITLPSASVLTTYTVDQFVPLEATGVTGRMTTYYASGTTPAEYLHYVDSGPEGMPIAQYAFTRTLPSVTAEDWRATSISPFGTILTSTGTGPVPPWRYAGQIELPYSDARIWVGSTNTLLRPSLNLNRWRVYDSFLGQYLQPEPLSVLGSEYRTGAYAYARLNPWNVIDPDGREPWPLNGGDAGLFSSSGPACTPEMPRPGSLACVITCGLFCLEFRANPPLFNRCTASCILACAGTGTN